MACHTAARVERKPDGRPVASNGEFAKHAVSTGPRSCARCQRALDFVRRTDVDVDLDRCRVAHHRAASRPRGVEVLLHRGVARLVQHALDITPRVDAGADEVDPGASERVTHATSMSACIAAMAALSPDAGGPLSSSCPPGSNVIRLPPGRSGSSDRSSPGARYAAVVGDGDPLELDADLSLRPTVGRSRREDLLVDVAVDVGDGEGAGRRRHRQRWPKWAATQVRFRTGADQRYQEFTVRLPGGRGRKRAPLPVLTGAVRAQARTLPDIRRGERARMTVVDKPYCAPVAQPMDLGFETIGNATVVVHDREPVLATDPWIEGSAYFGSWGLSHPVPPAQAARSSPPGRCGSRTATPTTSTRRRSLASATPGSSCPTTWAAGSPATSPRDGYRVEVLPDATWVRISDRVRVLCIADEGQDAVLLIDVGGDSSSTSTTPRTAVGERW